MRAIVFLSLVLIACSRACAAASPDRGFYVQPSAGVLVLSGGSDYVPEHDNPMLGLVGVSPALRTTCSRATDIQSLRFGYRFARIWSLEAEVVRVGSWSQRQQTEAAVAFMYDSDIGNQHSEIGGSLNALATFALTKRWSVYLGVGYGLVRDKVTTTWYYGMVSPVRPEWVSVGTLRQAKLIGGLDLKVTERVDLRLSAEQLFLRPLETYPKPRMLALTLGAKVGL